MTTIRLLSVQIPDPGTYGPYRAVGVRTTDVANRLVEVALTPADGRAIMMCPELPELEVEDRAWSYRL